MSTYPGLPVIMCGMVGSKHGWVEAPYASCPASVESISQYLVPVPNEKEWKILVLPGLTCSLGDTDGDVRGYSPPFVNSDVRVNMACTHTHTHTHILH